MQDISANWHLKPRWPNLQHERKIWVFTENSQIWNLIRPGRMIKLWKLWTKTSYYRQTRRGWGGPAGGGWRGCWCPATSPWSPPWTRCWPSCRPPSGRRWRPGPGGPLGPGSRVCGVARTRVQQGGRHVAGGTAPPPHSRARSRSTRHRSSEADTIEYLMM